MLMLLKLFCQRMVLIQRLIIYLFSFLQCGNCTEQLKTNKKTPPLKTNKQKKTARAHTQNKTTLFFFFFFGSSLGKILGIKRTTFKCNMRKSAVAQSWHSYILATLVVIKLNNLLRKVCQLALQCNAIGKLGCVVVLSLTFAVVLFYYFSWYQQ